MKARTYIIVSLVATVFSSAIFSACNRQNATKDIDVGVIENRAAIKFERDLLDFHTINSGEIVSGSFKFKNTGKNNLIISDVTANCGCTVADYPKNEIKPGEEGMITVTYDSKGVSGMKILKEVTVLANTTPARTVLKITADVR